MGFYPTVATRQGPAFLHFHGEVTIVCHILNPNFRQFKFYPGRYYKNRENDLLNDFYGLTLVVGMVAGSGFPGIALVVRGEFTTGIDPIGILVEHDPGVIVCDKPR